MSVSIPACKDCSRGMHVLQYRTPARTNSLGYPMTKQTPDRDGACFVCPVCDSAEEENPKSR